MCLRRMRPSDPPIRIVVRPSGGHRKLGLRVVDYWSPYGVASFFGAQGEQLHGRR